MHAAERPETKHLISDREFKLMKKSAYIVNSARGPIIDEKAMVRALQAKEIAGAGLDVYENEPNPNKDLIKHPLTACTPHIGAATSEAQDRIGEEIASLVIQHLK